MMVAKTYYVLDRAIEEGVARGYRYAYKHTDAPDEKSVCEHMAREVMNAIDEVFEFVSVPE